MNNFLIQLQKHLPGIMSALITIGTILVDLGHFLGQIHMSGWNTATVSGVGLMGIVGLILHNRTV